MAGRYTNHSGPSQSSALTTYGRDRSPSGTRAFGEYGTEESGIVSSDQYFEDVEVTVSGPEDNAPTPLVNVIATVKYDAATITIGGEHDMEIVLLVNGVERDQADFVLEAGEERFAPGLSYDFSSTEWGEDAEITLRLFRTTRDRIQMDETNYNVQVPEPADEPADGTGGDDDNGGDNSGE